MSYESNYFRDESLEIVGGKLRLVPKSSRKVKISAPLSGWKLWPWLLETKGTDPQPRWTDLLVPLNISETLANPLSGRSAPFPFPQPSGFQAPLMVPWVPCPQPNPVCFPTHASLHRGELYERVCALSLCFPCSVESAYQASLNDKENFLIK